VFGDIARLRGDLDQLTGSIRIGPLRADEDDAWTPPVDIHEEDDALILLVDLPGIKRDDIDLLIHEDSLTLEGERNRARDEGGVRLERPMGRFRRSFRIGVSIDTAGVQATYREGVLRVRLPRAAPQGPRRVDVGVK
jgi:HSP20 family protein